jgi:hypothetical protein
MDKLVSDAESQGSSLEADQNRLPHRVITVHGIRTFGLWRERPDSLLHNEVAKSEQSLEVVNYKFGYFSIVAFLLPVFR